MRFVFERLNYSDMSLFTSHHTHTHTHTHTPNQELHMRPHLPIFCHNTFLYCILSFQQFITLANSTVNSLKMVYYYRNMSEYFNIHFTPYLYICWYIINIYSPISAHNNSFAAVGEYLNVSTESHPITIIWSNYFYGLLWDDGQPW